MLRSIHTSSALAATKLARILRLSIFLLGCLICSDGPVIAQTSPGGDAANFPDRPIHIIVPFAPGGASDVLARIVGEKLSQAWNQPVVIDNRPGAGGNLGAEVAARATPDGYTLLLVADAVRATGLNYNVVDDFSPITLGTVTPMVVVVPPTLPVDSIGDLLALAKKQQLFWGSGGVGSSIWRLLDWFSGGDGADTHGKRSVIRAFRLSCRTLLAGRLSCIVSARATGGSARFGAAS